MIDAATGGMRNEDDRLISAKEVARAYGVHEITAWKWAAIGRIPAPVKRGKRYTRWSNAEIQRDIREMREAERREATT